MSDGTWKNTANDLVAPNGGKVKNITAGAATGEAVEHDQFTTAVATGGTANRLIKAGDTSGNKTAGATALGEDSSGRLTGSSAGALGSGAAVSPLGAGFADENVAIGAAGATHNSDIPIPTTVGVVYWLDILSIIVETADTTKKAVRTTRLLVDRGASAPSLSETLQDTFTPLGGTSLLNGQTTFSVSGQNLRVATASNASVACKVNVYAWLRSGPYPA